MCCNHSKKKTNDSFESYPELDYVKKSKTYRKFSCLIISFSVILIVISVMCQATIPCMNPWLESLLNIIVALSASALAGAFITTVLDLPEVVDGFRQVILDAFTSDSYINLLPKEKLEDIRVQTLRRIHKDSSTMPEDFIDIDSTLEALVDKPYYQFFNENVNTGKRKSYKDCVEDMSKYKQKSGSQDSASLDNISGEYFIRESVLEYELVNPLKTADAIVDIAIKKSTDLRRDVSIKDMFILTQCEIALDDMAPVSINPVIKYRTKKGNMASDPQTMTYNSLLSLASPLEGVDEISVGNIDKLKDIKETKYEENTSSVYSTMNIRFNKRLKVRMEYKQIIPSNDNHYTRRMRYASKEYLVHFSCEDDYRVHGQVLGTLIDQKKISISQNERNPKEVLIHCRSWLLPGNGTFIVLDDK